MRLRHIEVFHAIYTTGSITNAAELLHVSQPSVSKVLQHAEMQLGFELFDRVKGKLIPTQEAMALMPEVDKIFQQLNSLKKAERNIKTSTSGRISISVMPALGLDILPQALQRFHSQYPDITFVVHTKHFDDVPTALFEREVDIGLLFDTAVTAQPGLQSVAIAEGELVCVHPAAQFEGKAAIEPEDLAEQTFISIVDSGPLGGIVADALQPVEDALHCPVQAHTYYVAKNLVGYGLGVAVVDEFTARAQGPQVATTPFAAALRFNVTGLYLESRPLSKVCQEFLECVREVVSEARGNAGPEAERQ